MTNQEDENMSSHMGEFIKRYDLGRLHYDLVDRIMFIIAAGLALIAALAWDDVLHIFFEKLFAYLGEPLTRSGYAAILTFLAGLVAVVFKKISKKRRKKRLMKNY